MNSEGRNSLFSDYKSLKRTTLLWSSATLATFIAASQLGEVSIFGTGIPAGHVSLVRISLAISTFYYFIEFISSATNERRLHTLKPIGSETHLLFERATEKLDAMTDEMREFIKVWSAVDVRIFKGHVESLPQIISQQITGFRSNPMGNSGGNLEIAESISTMYYNDIRNSIDGIIHTMDEISNRNGGEWNALTGAIQKSSKEFKKQISSLAISVNGMSVAQFWFLDVGVVTSMTLIACVGAAFPVHGLQVRDTLVEISNRQIENYTPSNRTLSDSLKGNDGRPSETHRRRALPIDNAHARPKGRA